MNTHATRRATRFAPPLLLPLGLIVWAFASPVSAAPEYTFTRIDLPGAVEAHGQGINNRGDLAGNAIDASGVLRGWIRAKDGTLTYYNFGVPGTTEVNGLNDTGVAWGGYLGADDIAHGFVLRHGVKTDLDLPGAFATVPIGINNRGFVSGVVVDAGGVHGFTGTEGAYAVFDYPAPGVAVTLLFGNNERGQVPGVYFDAQGGHGFLKSGSTLVPIHFPGSAYTQPATINNSGDIVGHYQTTPGLPAHIPEHGLLVKNGVYRTLNYPGAAATRLFQINDAGDIIGSALDQNGRSFAFVAKLGK
jgi:hypothetical protein